MASPKSVKASKTEEAAARSWTAKPVLGPEFTEAPPLEEVYVGVLKERKDTSAAIQSVSAALPGFAHLKRCSNGRLLLAPLRSGGPSAKGHGISLGEAELKRRLEEKGFNLSLLEDAFQVTEVPSRAPRTKSQASRASRIWPVNFHPDQTIERLIDGSVFDDERLRAIERIMWLVIRAGELEAVGDERCTGAAAVVDPEDGRILAIAAARLDRHPMWHASMLAVDLVAKLHGGGAWQLGGDEDAMSKGRDAARAGTVGDERTNPTTDEAESSKRRLTRIKRRYEEETPLCHPGTLSALRFPCQVPLETGLARRNNGTEEKTPQRGEGGESDAEKRGPYLCTGYWAFLLAEPCPLCAMALLHSRVARVFYGAANPSAGVLGSRALLHTLPGLNHRYRVWSGILERECQRTVEGINARRNVTKSPIERRFDRFK